MTTVSQTTPSPKPSSSAASTQTASGALPKAKTSSETTQMPAPPVKPKAGSESGGPSTSRAPSGAASLSSVTTGPGYPTIAESLGQKRSPPLKAAPSSKSTMAPSTKSDDTKLVAAKGSTPDPSKGKAEMASKPQSTTSTSKVQETTQPARAQRAPEAQAPIDKDAAMTYTEKVMQQAASAVPVNKLTDEGCEKMAQERWQRMLTESATSISHRPAPVAHLPKELRSEILPPQPLSSPIRGWMV